jgi:hypothetical protein
VFRSLLEFLLGVPLRGEMPVPVLRREARLLRQAHLGPEIYRPPLNTSAAPPADAYSAPTHRAMCCGLTGFPIRSRVASNGPRAVRFRHAGTLVKRAHGGWPAGEDPVTGLQGTLPIFGAKCSQSPPLPRAILLIGLGGIKALGSVGQSKTRERSGFGHFLAMGHSSDGRFALKADEGVAFHDL